MVEMLEQLTFKYSEGNFRLRHGEIFLCSQFMDACNEFRVVAEKQYGTSDPVQKQQNL